MSDAKNKSEKARKEMRDSANKATTESSKALQDDALTKAEKPIKTKLDG